MPGWRHDGDEDTSGFEQIMHVAHVLNILTVAERRIGDHLVEHAKRAIASKKISEVDGVRVKLKLRHRGIQLDTRSIDAFCQCSQDRSSTSTGFQHPNAFTHTRHSD